MTIKKSDKSYLDIKSIGLDNYDMLNMFNVLIDEEETYFFNIFKEFTVSDTIMDNQSYLNNIIVIDPWWENISYSYYNLIELWWLVCVVNDVLNPFEEIEEAQTLTMLPKNIIMLLQNDMSVINNL